MDQSEISSERPVTRENDSTAKFFKRLSSIKVEYEKDKRRTLQKFKSVYVDDSEEVTFFKPKDEIVELLRETLEYENLIELYKDVLLLLFPTEKDVEANTAKPLLQFLKKVFAFDLETHLKLLKATKQSSAKDKARVLYVKLVEAKDLPAKDVNGFSDPFCTLYLTSREQSKRTQVAKETLHPKWNETFKFPVNNLVEDVLRIKVWDQDPPERIRDKLGRVTQLRPKNIRPFIADLSHGRSATQELIGKVSIPLKEISMETVEKWYSLRNHEKRGELYIETALGIEKMGDKAVQQYQLMLQLLLIHEVASSAVVFEWQDFKEPWAEYVLRQLRTGWGISEKEVLLAKWQAYVRIHTIFPLKGRLFPMLANDVFQKVSESKYYNTQEVACIWSSTEELVGFFTSYVEKLHLFFSCVNTISQLYYILRTLKLLLRPVDGIVNYQHTAKTYVNETYILTGLKGAIRKSALKSFDRILKKTLVRRDNDLPHETTESYYKDVEKRISEYVDFCTLLNEDLTNDGGKLVQNEFKQILGIDYHMITYHAYDEELSKLVKPAIEEFCSVLKSTCQSGKGKYLRSISDSSSTADSSTNQCDIASPFFKFYMALKQFSEQAPKSRSSHGWRVTNSLFQWMYPAVTHLLEIFSFVWKGWMEKAVKKDYSEETPVIQREVLEYNGYQISSCAVDATDIISQINRFWANLSWPPAEESAVSIVESIIQEVSHYSISFGDLVATVSKRSVMVERSGLIAEQFCRSINNVVYVGRHTSDIIKQLALHQQEEDEGKKTKQREFIEKQVEIQRSGLHSIIVEGMLRSLGKQLRPRLTEYLKRICDSTVTRTTSKGNDERSANVPSSRRKDTDLVGEFLEYIGENLGMIGRALVSEHFDDAILMMWEETLGAAKAIVAVGLQDHKPYTYFEKLKSVLENLKSYFKSSVLARLSSKSSFSSSSTISVLDGGRKSTCDFLKSLEIYGMKSGELKSQYFAGRHESQKEASGDLGMVALRFYYDTEGEVLTVELLNARKLVPINNSNGTCDPYCELQLEPYELFPSGVTKAKTSVVKETSFPCFDQTFRFCVSRGVLDLKYSGYLRIAVYDQHHDYFGFGKDDFLGEVYVLLKDVPASHGPKNIRDCQQSILALTKPTSEQIQGLNSLLNHRTWDKYVQRFLKNEAEKSRG